MAMKWLHIEQDCNCDVLTAVRILRHNRSVVAQP